MASLIGRIIPFLCFFVAACATTTPKPSEAAPFAAIIMDARSGETLWSKNADTRLHPASLTKMMTLYIAFQEIEAGRITLDTKVTVTKHAAAQPPSRLGLKPGQKISLRYLIRAAAVKSANDAATAIGEAISGSEAAFAKRMTKTARALGMTNTTFKNANGLTAEGHLSTARDMNTLGRHLFYDFPQYYNIFSRRTADAGIATVSNTNTRFLDAYEGADGIKTGYTVAAGFNLTASAKRGDKRIITTVFGGTSTANRNAKMKELMDMGFELARKGVREKKPNAAPLIDDGPRPDDAAIAAAVSQAIDEPGAEGGAAKTIRVSGEVTRSLRPRPRPDAPAQAEAAVAAADVPDAPDPLADAIAEGVAMALAEPPPPPEGTLEAQALDLAAAPAAPAEAAPPPPEGSLDAQAVALADGTPTAAEGTLQAQAEALSPVADPALAGLRPQPRPETPLDAGPETTPETTPEVALAEADIAGTAPAEGAAIEPPPLEVVAAAEDPGHTALALAEVPAAEAPALAEAPAAELTDVQTVAADATAPIADPDGEPARKAPIFEAVAMAEPAPEEAEELVVVTKSTSGGRHWGVAVGAYASRYEAERALLKTGLAESATLDQGLRKITEKGGKYRASFLGLTEDQADLACRRLRARGMACETTGPG